MADDNELVFVPLGGLGEIGMNCALYGYGPASARQWLMVDLGIGFADEDLPGIDLIMPDLSFIEKAKKNSGRGGHHSCTRRPYRRSRRALA